MGMILGSSPDWRDEGISAELAAMLIVGAQSLTPAALHVLSEMQESYDAAMRHYLAVRDMDEAKGWSQEHRVLPESALRSHDMERCEHMLAQEQRRPGVTFEAWLAGPNAAFDKQKFRPEELARWLSARHISSSHYFLADEKGLPANRNDQGAGTRGRTAANSWAVYPRARYRGYMYPLYCHLKQACEAHQPLPTPREVLEAWKRDPPEILIGQPSDTSFEYRDETGKKEVSLRSLSKSIKALTQPSKRRGSRGDAA